MSDVEKAPFDPARELTVEVQFNGIKYGARYVISDVEDRLMPDLLEYKLIILDQLYRQVISTIEEVER